MGKPTKEEQAWRQLASEMGAEFIQGKSRDNMTIMARVKQWTIILHTHLGGGGYPPAAGSRFTRIMAPYVSKDGFRFKVGRRAAFPKLWRKLFRTKDVQIGHPDFERDFAIKSNDELKAQRLFGDDAIRHLIRLQLPWGDGLRILEPAQVPGNCLLEYDLDFHRVTDLEGLKSHFGLVEEILNHLSRMGSASEQEPDADAVRSLVEALSRMS